ncbi:hypothetical protein BS78_02G256200 [Paspalum vaginatum]|nr:hypothetical protein BS78_02G256200 [Paspalum vaginatum]
MIFSLHDPCSGQVLLCCPQQQMALQQELDVNQGRVDHLGYGLGPLHDLADMGRVFRRPIVKMAIGNCHMQSDNGCCVCWLCGNGAGN